MPQLDPTSFASQLFWLAVFFCALYLILSRRALPLLMGIMAKRQETIASDIDTAQHLKVQAERAKENYERTLADSRAQAQQLIDDALLAQKTHAEQSATRLDAQVASQLAEATVRIGEKKRELLAALTPTAAELTSMIVEKLTLRAPPSDQVTRVVNELSAKINSRR